MKKLFYIMIATLVALTACTKEMDVKEAPAIDSETGYPEGATVELVFGIPTPPQTRGEMGDQPILDDLHVAVFDGSGSLREYAPAERFDKATINGSAGKQYFKVELKLRNSESHLHFIVNGPESSGPGMEANLLKQWVTEYPNAAYWQRIVLPDGVTAYSFSRYKSKDTPWAAGDKIYFYYEVISETEIAHISKAYYEAYHTSDSDPYKVAIYEIQFNGNRPYYNDGLNIVNVGDYVNAKGEKILDGTGYFQSASITDAVASVPLVRNFARIKIRAGSGGNFTPTEYYLMNIPDKGTIAPYSEAVGGVASVYSASNYYTSQYDPDDPDAEPIEPYWETANPAIFVLTEGETENHSELMTALNGGRYPATMPASANLIQKPSDVTKNESNQNVLPTDDEGHVTWTKYSVAPAGTTVDNVPSAFMFERGLPTKNQDPTYLLIGGTLQGHSEQRWFKVELTNRDGQYIRIFRDVTYFLEIGQVNGSEGYASAADAAVGLSVSDVSNSLATQNLEQVSDGKSPSTTMWVSYIDYVGNRPGGEAKEILYKVYTSEGALDPEISGESRYTLVAEGDCFELENGEPKIVENGSGFTGPDGQSDWCKATVYLKAPATDGTISHGTLKISGITEEGERLENGKSLSREVKYHVMGIQDLTLSATPLATEAAGERTKLSITLPRNLGYSMFPLVLRIEAEKGNLNPVNAVDDNNVPINNINGVKVDLPVDSGTSYFKDKNSFAFLFTINYSDYYDQSNSANPYNQTFELWFETTRGYNTQGATGSNETYFSVTDNNAEHYFFYKPENGSDLYNPSVNKAITPVTVTSPNWYFSLSTSEVSVNADVKTATFSVQTNATNSWSLSTSDSGFTTNPALGTSVTGSRAVTVEFDEVNTGTADKVIHLTVTPTNGTAQTVTVTQKRPLRKVTRNGTASFTGNNFSSGSNQTSTNDSPIKVNFSLISSIWNNYVEVSENQSTTLTITPESSASMEDVTITGITLQFYRGNSRNYNPASISGPFSGGTGDNNNTTSLNATYNGSNTTDAVQTVLTARTGREFDMQISVSYSYSAWE